uniref:Uncharacterized protein n=1 Tax=Oryctolagus cuniculus TaxID=9986 RepID=A0A5F9D497_RABIT
MATFPTSAGERHTAECPPIFSDRKNQISESPIEATDTNFSNHGGTPKGPRDPHSQWM